MSIRYRKVQNKIEGSKSYQMWYPRAVVLNTVDTEAIAEEISHSTTMTFADIMGVLIELTNVLKRHLLNSDKVHLFRLGSFRVGIKSTPSANKKDVSANNVTGYRVIYSPEITFTPTGVNSKGNRIGFYTKSLLQGATASELGDGSTTDKTSTATNP